MGSCLGRNSFKFSLNWAWRFSATALVFLSPCLAHGKWPPDNNDLREFDEQIVMGPELELTERPLRNIAKWFDSTLLTPQLLPKAELNSYLDDNPAAFDALDPAVQSELSEGRKLTPPKISTDLQIKRGSNGESIIRPDAAHAPRSTTAPIIGPAQSSKIILPNGAESRTASGLYLRGSTETIKTVAPSGPATNAEANTREFWETVKKNWQALPDGRKRWLVRTDLLTDAARARVLVADPRSISLSAKAPRFMEAYRWKKDLGAIEFYFSDPPNSFDSPTACMNAVKSLAKAAGIWEGFSDPLQSVRWDSALHLHISRRNPKGENLEPLAKELARLITVQSVAAGDLNVLKFSTRYQTNVTFRGPVRYITNSDQIELRLTAQNLETTVKYALAHMTMDQKEAVKSVQDDIRAVITPVVLQTIAAHASPEVCDDLLADVDMNTRLEAVSDLMRHGPVSRDLLSQNPYRMKEAIDTLANLTQKLRVNPSALSSELLPLAHQAPSSLESRLQIARLLPMEIIRHDVDLAELPTEAKHALDHPGASPELQIAAIRFLDAHGNPSGSLNSFDDKELGEILHASIVGPKSSEDSVTVRLSIGGVAAVLRLTGREDAWLTYTLREANAERGASLMYQAIADSILQEVVPHNPQVIAEVMDFVGRRGASDNLVSFLVNHYPQEVIMEGLRRKVDSHEFFGALNLISELAYVQDLPKGYGALRDRAITDTLEHGAPDARSLLDEMLIGRWRNTQLKTSASKAFRRTGELLQSSDTQTRFHYIRELFARNPEMVPGVFENCDLEMKRLILDQIKRAGRRQEDLSAYKEVLTQAAHSDDPELSDTAKNLLADLGKRDLAVDTTSACVANRVRADLDLSPQTLDSGERQAH